MAEPARPMGLVGPRRAIRRPDRRRPGTHGGPRRRTGVVRREPRSQDPGQGAGPTGRGTRPGGGSGGRRVLSDGNIELVATLLEEARAGREHAYPGALVLPPGALSESLRWIDTWPQLGPADCLVWLGLPQDVSWP